MSARLKSRKASVRIVVISIFVTQTNWRKKNEKKFLSVQSRHYGEKGQYAEIHACYRE